MSCVWFPSETGLGIPPPPPNLWNKESGQAQRQALVAARAMAQVCRERASAEPPVVGRPPPWPARPRARYPICRSGGDGVVTEAAGAVVGEWIPF